MPLCISKSTLPSSCKDAPLPAFPYYMPRSPIIDFDPHKLATVVEENISPPAGQIAAQFIRITNMTGQNFMDLGSDGLNILSDNNSTIFEEFKHLQTSPHDILKRLYSTTSHSPSIVDQFEGLNETIRIAEMSHAIDDDPQWHLEVPTAIGIPGQCPKEIEPFDFESEPDSSRGPHQPAVHLTALVGTSSTSVLTCLEPSIEYDAATKFEGTADGLLRQRIARNYGYELSSLDTSPLAKSVVEICDDTFAFTHEHAAMNVTRASCAERQTLRSSESAGLPSVATENDNIGLTAEVNSATISPIRILPNGCGQLAETSSISCSPNGPGAIFIDQLQTTDGSVNGPHEPDFSSISNSSKVILEVVPAIGQQIPSESTSPDLLCDTQPQKNEESLSLESANTDIDTKLRPSLIIDPIAKTATDKEIIKAAAIPESQNSDLSLDNTVSVPSPLISSIAQLPSNTHEEIGSITQWPDFRYITPIRSATSSSFNYAGKQTLLAFVERPYTDYSSSTCWEEDEPHKTAIEHSLSDAEFSDNDSIASPRSVIIHSEIPILLTPEPQLNVLHHEDFVDDVMPELLNDISSSPILCRPLEEKSCDGLISITTSSTFQSPLLFVDISPPDWSFWDDISPCLTSFGGSVNPYRTVTGSLSPMILSPQSTLSSLSDEAPVHTLSGDNENAARRLKLHKRTILSSRMNAGKHPTRVKYAEASVQTDLEIRGELSQILVRDSHHNPSSVCSAAPPLSAIAQQNRFLRGFVPGFWDHF